jgi:SOS-response transcriptional repressor LexA
MMDDPSDIAIILCWHISNTTAHVKRLSKRHGKLLLMPEHQQYPPLAITETTTFEIWGVVPYVQPSSCLCSRYFDLQPNASLI